MAAVVYVRMVMYDGTVHCAFVIGKSRLAPLKHMSIVRLELQAAVLAVRLMKTVLKEISFKPDDVVFWSDSKVVIAYIGNKSRRFHVFVANRVAEIHESTKPEQWRHVPGKINPADDGTRGVSALRFQSDSRWIQGPAFLWDSDEAFPSTNVTEIPLQPEDPEVKMVATTLKTTILNRFPMPDTSRFSSWSRYNRSVCWMLRFANNFAVRCGCKTLTAKSGPLSADELIHAEYLIIKETQTQVYRQEILDLQSGKQVSRRSPLVQLSPFMDELGIMRVGGRLKHAPLNVNAKNPVVLPPDHDITKLIISSYHRKLMHVGVEHTLNEIRQQYWSTKARSRVKKVLRECRFCHRRRAQPQRQMMSDLPQVRFQSDYAFSCVGIDYFGPLYTRKFRKTEKRYGVLFTCLSTRAVHLETAASLDTDRFLMALRRFIARRGTPVSIYSDNGTNLKAGEKELRVSISKFNQDQIVNNLSQKQIKWYFNPPAASHMGGVWERLVGVVKRCIKAVLGNQTVKDEVLHTVLTEVEYVVNSRPITHVSTDGLEPEALTQNHILLGHKTTTLPPGVFDYRDVYRKGWRHAQRVADHFWTRWRKEYIPLLIQRGKWQNRTRNIKVDDVVLMAKDNDARGYWPLARVIRTNQGKDGLVRSVELKTAQGAFVRPITKVCLLENSDC